MVIKHQHFFREAYVSIRCLLVVACSLIVREVKGMKEGTGFRKLLCPWNPSIGDVLRWPFSSICSFPVMDFKGGLTGYIFMITQITGSSWQFDSTTATNFPTASPSNRVDLFNWISSVPWGNNYVPIFQCKPKKKVCEITMQLIFMSPREKNLYSRDMPNLEVWPGETDFFSIISVSIICWTQSKTDSSITITVYSVLPTTLSGNHWNLLVKLLCINWYLLKVH